MSIEEQEYAKSLSYANGLIDKLEKDTQRLVEEIERQSNVIHYLKVDVKTYMDGGLEKRRLIVKQEKQIESLQQENQRLVEALEISDSTIEGILQTLSTPLHQTETGTSRLIHIEETMRRHQFYKQNPADWAQFKKTIQAYKLLERKEK